MDLICCCLLGHQYLQLLSLRLLRKLLGCGLTDGQQVGCGFVHRRAERQIVRVVRLLRCMLLRFDRASVYQRLHCAELLRLATRASRYFEPLLAAAQFELGFVKRRLAVILSKRVHVRDRLECDRFIAPLIAVESLPKGLVRHELFSSADVKATFLRNLGQLISAKTDVLLRHDRALSGPGGGLGLNNVLRASLNEVVLPQHQLPVRSHL